MREFPGTWSRSALVVAPYLTSRIWDLRVLRIELSSLRMRWTLVSWSAIVERSAPTFLEVGMVSSHAPWTPVLPLLDWDDMGDGTAFLVKYLTYGGSPRASQYLILGAKARAILSGRFHVDFDDVRKVANPVLRHRLVLNFHARAEGIDADCLIARLLEMVPEK